MSEQHELRHVQHSDVQPHPSSSRFSSDADVDNAELELDERDERARMLRSSLDGSEGTSGEGKHDPDEVEGLVEGSIEALIAKNVPTTDDPTLPTFTLRAALLGSIFTVAGAASQQVFYFRANPPSWSTYFVVLASYPLGNALARILPKRTFFGMELNPASSFSIKEHVLVGVMATSGGTAAYASDILAILSLYYKTDLNAVAGITLLLTTQLIGFGMSGLLQELLVKPPSMYFPTSLVYVSLYHTLHAKSSSLTKDRLSFFLVAFTACFVYQFLPGFIAPVLSSIPLLCLLSNPTTRVLRMLGSGYDGVGWFDFSLDWAAIGSAGPLYLPFWALNNYFGGAFLMIWIVLPILWFANFWDAQSFSSPVAASLYSKSFEHFNFTSILTPELTLDIDAWDKAAPLLLTPYFAFSYALSFASLSSVVVYVWLFHGEEIKSAWKKRGEARGDVHNRLMQSYESVPKSWYGWMIGGNLVAAGLLVTFAPLQTPLWSLLLALLLAVAFLIPVGIVFAVSGTQIGLNVMTEFVHGLLQPGKPIGNVFFKCFGYMALSQCLALTADLKLALYLKVPYKDMFKAQVLGTALGAVTNYWVLLQVIAAKRPFLDGTEIDPTGQWDGRAPKMFFSASVIWGLISPARFFAGKYWVLYLGFPVGAILPLLTYRLHKRYPSSNWDKVVFPIIIHGATCVPQSPANILLSGFIVTIVFHRYVVRYHPRWSEKYQFTLSAALDAGTSLSAMAVYLFFMICLGWSFPNWAGNPATDSEHCRS